MKENSTMENKGNAPADETKKHETIYRIAISVLFLLVVLLAVLWFSSRKTLKEVTVEREVAAQLNIALQHELDSVLEDYFNFKIEYDSVLADKDSIIQANAAEIQGLIARQADYYRIRRQLNLLQEITQNYVKEIDELYTENRVLRAENVQMREEIRQVQRRTTELVADKQVLESKVEEASALRAYQIETSSFRIRGRDREYETDRANRVEQIRVCFVIGENPIIPAGSYNVYMRIAKPDGEILRISDTDAYSFIHQGDTLQYSVAGAINYMNREKRTCLTWVRNEEFGPGIYHIALYTDGNQLGNTALELR